MVTVWEVPSLFTPVEKHFYITSPAFVWTEKWYRVSLRRQKRYGNRATETNWNVCTKTAFGQKCKKSDETQILLLIQDEFSHCEKKKKKMKLNLAKRKLVYKTRSWFKHHSRQNYYVGERKRIFLFFNRWESGICVFINRVEIIPTFRKLCRNPAVI